METLEKLIYDLYKKNARQCTDEEIYNALLIYTKNQLFDRAEFLYAYLIIATQIFIYALFYR